MNVTLASFCLNWHEYLHTLSVHFKYIRFNFSTWLLSSAIFFSQDIQHGFVFSVLYILLLDFFSSLRCMTPNQCTLQRKYVGFICGVALKWFALVVWSICWYVEPLLAIRCSKSSTPNINTISTQLMKLRYRYGIHVTHVNNVYNKVSNLSSCISVCFSNQFDLDEYLVHFSCVSNELFCIFYSPIDKNCNR